MAKWKRWILGKWNWMRPVKSLVFIYCSVAFVACTFPNQFIFHPPFPQYGEDDPDVVLLDPGEKQVACLYYPPGNNERVLLWAHGNAEDLGVLRSLLVDLHNHGFGVLAYDYPGYGHSAGAPSETSCFRAAKRAYEFLTNQQGLDPSRIILVGQSVGSGPACWLAEREELGGLILITPILSAFRTLTRIPILPGDVFRNLGRIRSIEEPLLVMHGSRDEVIPFAHGRRLYKEHRGPKEFLEIPDSRHNDIWIRGRADMMRAIKQFANARTP